MKYDALGTLIEQTREARDSASRTLAADRNARARTASQLEALEQYRDEYRNRLQSALAQGLDADALHNFRGFLQSLGQAIGSAGLRLQQHDTRIDASQRDLGLRQRQLSSYQTLAARRHARSERIAQRREQRRTDEAGSRSSSRGTPR